MPKLKTVSGAKKRFRATKNGVKYRAANRNHILTKKAHKRKRQLRSQRLLKACQVAEVRRMLCLGNKSAKNVSTEGGADHA